MIWTTEKPSKPGYYQVRNTAGSPVRIMRVDTYAGYHYCALGYLDRLDHTWEWAGPIPEPEEPS